MCESSHETDNSDASLDEAGQNGKTFEVREKGNNAVSVAAGQNGKTFEVHEKDNNAVSVEEKVTMNTCRSTSNVITKNHNSEPNNDSFNTASNNDSNTDSIKNQPEGDSTCTNDNPKTCVVVDEDLTLVKKKS